MGEEESGLEGQTARPEEGLNQKGVLRYEVPKQADSTPKISRRRFLVGLGALSVSLYLGSKLNRVERPREDNSSIKEFEASQDRHVDYILSRYGFQEHAVRKMMKMEGISKGKYGILASSSVSVIPQIESGDNYIYTLGSGSLARMKDEHYLVTTTHVIDLNLEHGEGAIHFSIPGLDTPYKMRPSEAYVFTEGSGIDLGRDGPILFKISDPELRRKIGRLENEGKLTPLALKPFTLSTDPNHKMDDTAAFLRFQGHNPALPAVKYEMKDAFANVPRVIMKTNNDQTVVCGGTSGTAVLRTDSSEQLTNDLIGVLSFGEESANSDPQSVLEGSCSNFAFVSTFSVFDLESGVKAHPLNWVDTS